MSARRRSIVTSKFTPIYREITSEGVQYLFRFPNNYGANVLTSPTSPDIVLLVLKYHGPSSFDYDLVYDTEVSIVMLEELTADRVEDILERIGQLPHTNADIVSEDAVEWVR